MPTHQPDPSADRNHGAYLLALRPGSAYQGTRHVDSCDVATTEGSGRLHAYKLAKRVPMPWMRDARAGANPRTGRERQSCSIGDLAQRIGVELRDDLAQKPRGIAIGGSASRPGAVLAMLFGNGIAAIVPRFIACARIVAGRGLGRERFASDFDCSQSTLPACVR